MQTVADLMAQVLRPIAGHRGLGTWEKLVAFAAEEWFPSRIGCCVETNAVLPPQGF